MYTGVTNNMPRRLQEHRSGKRGAKYTRGRGPLTVAWCAKVIDKSAALREEARIKKLPKQAKEQLAQQFNPLLRAYLECCPQHKEFEDNPGLVRRVVEHRDKLVARYSWAIPTETALSEVLSMSPIVEMGAGTGYWTALLRRMGADVVALDRSPPGSLKSLVAACNPWHVNARQHSKVQTGQPSDLRVYGDRTLLLCWPPRGSMASQCLQHWTGENLVYVGELASDTMADPEFFEVLREKFDMSGLVEIPKWPGINDTMTVWRRRAR
jgi:predicted GIY-YIG superfamily endonuclease